MNLDDEVKKNYEIFLLSFLRDNYCSNACFYKKYPKTFPDAYRKVVPDKIDSRIVIYRYPVVKRDNFEKDTGFKIEAFDNVTGKIKYLGNFSIELKFLQSKDQIENIGYSYKFWYVDSTYDVLTSKVKIESIVFNIRIDKDPNHKSQQFDLENHVSFLHTQPRIRGEQTSIPEFFKYLQNEIIPLTEMIHIRPELHICEINR